MENKMSDGLTEMYSINETTMSGWDRVSDVLNAKGQSSALNKQIDGNHYKDMKIQPVEFIHANNMPFIEGCIVKYISRWRVKNGVRDLQKARHFIDLLIQLESKK